MKIYQENRQCGDLFQFHFLRNRINQAIEDTIQNDWLINELNNQNILLTGEFNKLQDAKQKLLKKGHYNFTKDDLIAKLSLGFWVYLCGRKYKNTLWHKTGFFKTVFVDYPNFSELARQCNEELITMPSLR